MTDRPPVLVVISHDAARPVDALVRLLDGMASFPAGVPVAVRVVANRDGDEAIDLPDRHRGVETVYRSNEGFNIGAWEAGWRRPPAYPGYLFLQDECRIVQSDWAGAFARRAAEPGVGLVGECPSPDWDVPWPDLADRFRGHTLRDHAVAGRPADRVDCYLDFFRRHDIPPGPRGDHLQALVLFATRAVLERVRGFPRGETYGEAIGAEIGMSKKVQAAGLTLARVGPEPFFYVEHPQWLHRRAGDGRPRPGRAAER